MSFLKSLLGDAEEVAGAAAPVVGGIFGGPVGAAAGAAIGKRLVTKGQQTKASGARAGSGRPSFTPSSAGDVAEARTQDKQRMSDQYGIDPRD